MLFDSRSLTAGFKRMQEAAKAKGKTAAIEQSDNLLRAVKAEGKKDGPTKQELYDKAVELKWRLKRKKGKKMTAGKELKRRMRVAGLYGRMWKKVDVSQTGTAIEITLANKLKYANAVNIKKKTFSRAAKLTNTKYRVRLQKLANQVTSSF